MVDPTPAPVKAPTFWGTVWADLKVVFTWFGQKIAAPGVAVIVVVGGIVLLAMGCKGLQIGGLLGSLLGKGGSIANAIGVANSVPPNRIGANGQVVPEGTADAKGDTQAVVVPINSPGLFSNPSTVTFTPPGATKPVEIQLPTGVTNNDVHQVIQVQPGQYAVTVKDTSGITAQQVDDLLAKYGAKA